MTFKQNISHCSGRTFEIFSLGLLILMISCDGKIKKSDNAKTAEMPTVSVAKRFKIEKGEGYSQVSVFNPWQGANNVVQTWYLVHRGNKIPAGVDPARVIFVPVENIICMSTTHLAMISALGEAGSVTGFSGTKFIYSKELAERVAQGAIHEVGFEDNLNKELILKLSPDLVMVYGVGSESSGYIGKLRELGVKAFFNADYLETDPLGKAEWIRLAGALYCREAMADSIFRALEQKYTALKNFISDKITVRPNVLLGLPFKDTWYISPGNSYISRLISDAGGNYLWADTESSYALPTSIENVYLKALNGEYWLNTGTARSKSEILSLDPRLGDLGCFKRGNLFNNNKRVNNEGGNDYWESGCLKPDVILQDLATILHPELFPDRELIYYKKLE